ncbi:DUF1192 domain-containing protein [Zavarzinia compransoris]|uniref:DUF1192 domain-containing protein n=1 Tax=Zavarzinia marina TaxID=2911065 RepID=UPI001F2193FB|nr:DUF1192 domain-containing protein [Zavarzinia marina]MCF4165273.1 DUF1192 domain-containing protein [Zavarzinia marina]
MAFDPEDERVARPGAALKAHLIAPAPLDNLSVEDIEARIESARAEIARCEDAIAKKKASRSAADAFFKR